MTEQALQEISAEVKNTDVAEGELRTILSSDLSDGAKVAAIAELLGCRSADEIAKAVNKKVRTVERHYAELRKSHPLRNSADTQMCGTQNCVNTQICVENPANLRTETTQICVVAPPAPADITTRPTKELPSEVVILNTNSPHPLKRKPKPEFGRSEALQAFHAYNDAALIAAIPQASRMTPDRERKIIARLKEFGLEGWHRALENIKSSPFLKGEGGNGKWRASLDFLLQASSFAKVHDGAYSANPKPAAAAMSALLKPRPRIKSEDEIYQENIAWAKSQGLLDEHVH
jgi:hypothetical protein